MYSNENIRKRIWLIADGIPLKLDNMTIKSSDAGKLLVTGWTNTIHFNNISKENIQLELKDLKSSFSSFSERFPELITIIELNNLKIEYHMAFDTGNAGLGLCSEIDGMLNWYINKNN